MGAAKLGVAVSAFALVALADHPGRRPGSTIFDISLLIYAIFPVALFALLVHPQSREYQKIWFQLRHDRRA